MTKDQPLLAELEKKLHENIKLAHEASLKPISVDEISNIVRQVITSLSGDMTAADLKLYSELQDMAGYINRAKKEIAAIQPEDISTSQIPRATDELDAVVGATEDATNKIMDVCDQISAIAEKIPAENKDELVACTTRIFEACNFQDITGQRITKVVQTLKYIDSKIEALLKALGGSIEIQEANMGVMSHEDAEKALLNGPQLPQNAIDQSEIDKLLGN